MKKVMTLYFVIGFLVILLVASLVYIGVLRIREREQQIYQAGAKAGYQTAVVDVMRKADTCNQVPLTYSNMTLYIVSVPCVQKAIQEAQAQQQPAPSQQI